MLIDEVLKVCYLFLIISISKIKIMKKHHYLLGVTVTMVLFVICIQIYWNYNTYKNYKIKTHQEIISTSSRGLDFYFDQQAKKNHINILSENDFGFDSMLDDIDLDKLLDAINLTKKNVFDTIIIRQSKQIKILSGKLDEDVLKKFPSRISFNFSDNQIKYDDLYNSINQDLEQLNFDLEFQILHIINQSDTIQYPKATKKLFDNPVNLKSSFIKPNEDIILNYNLSHQTIIRQMGFELIISLLFTLGIILLLWFLIKTINNQKQIDQIKNDFISNITHELKTPIATINVAIEGIKHFNETHDNEKTERYLNIADSQNKKLNHVVEKILELSTLEVGELKLNLHKINLSNLINNSILNINQNLKEKQLSFDIENNIETFVDEFHFSNVFNNLIDNALKYGGEQIFITLKNQISNIELTVEDSGKISDTEVPKLFEKFYRTSTGNIHQHKGYGIGLYYAKKIVEKHQGSLTLNNVSNTKFILTLPIK